MLGLIAAGRDGGGDAGIGLDVDDRTETGAPGFATKSGKLRRTEMGLSAGLDGAGSENLDDVGTLGLAPADHATQLSRRDACVGERRERGEDPGAGDAPRLDAVAQPAVGLGAHTDYGREAGAQGSEGVAGLSVGPLLLGFRSEEHTSELQSQSNLVCRLLLEKKKKIHIPRHVG